MTLTAPGNNSGVTQKYTATPMIGKNGASTAQAQIHVSGHCPCYALEISTSAQHHAVDPFILASIAARESGGFPPDNDPLCGSMDPLHNGSRIGSDGTGHGLFQIDDGTWFFATTPGVKDANQNADFAGSIFASLLLANGGNVTGALHDYNVGPNKAIPTTGHYESGVVALRQQFVNQNYSFACTTKLMANASTLSTVIRVETNFVQSALFHQVATSSRSLCA